MRQAVKVKQALERQIIAGEFRPGDRLEEVEIATRFNVSRTPVREALMMLEAIDLVDRKPRVGAVVKGITLKRLLQTMEVLTSLEQLAARLAAKRVRPPELEALRQAHEASRLVLGRDDTDEIYDRSIDFHRAIYAAAYNQVLGEQIEFFGQRLAPFFRKLYRQPGWPESAFAKHADLLEAISERDADRAFRIMESMADIGTTVFSDFASLMDEQ